MTDPGTPIHRKRPTLVDVAREAGVSVATVSYVLSGPKVSAARISPETTSRVLEVAQELGYVPNQSARMLRRRRTDRVLFLAGRISSLYSQEMATSIRAGLARHDLACTVQVGSEIEHVQQAISALRERLVDGLIVEAVDDAIPLLHEAAAGGFPIVAIGPDITDLLMDVVSIQLEPAIREAMDHFVERGYRDVLLLSTRPAGDPEPRIAIAYQRLLEIGVPSSSISVRTCLHDRIHAHDLALELLPSLPRPLAVYGGSDVSAIGVLWACRRLGLDVPGEVAIVGHGNTLETGITVPRLASLGPVSTDFGQAADLIASRIRSPSLESRQIHIPCAFTAREST